MIRSIACIPQPGQDLPAALADWDANLSAFRSEAQDAGYIVNAQMLVVDGHLVAVFQVARVYPNGAGGQVAEMPTPEDYAAKVKAMRRTR